MEKTDLKQAEDGRACYYYRDPLTGLVCTWDGDFSHLIVVWSTQEMTDQVGGINPARATLGLMPSSQGWLEWFGLVCAAWITEQEVLNEEKQ